MTRFFLFLFLILPSFVTAGEPDERLHQECLYPTVAIQEQHDERTPASGTGVIISSWKSDGVYINRVATVAHIILPQNLEDTPARYKYDIKFGRYQNWSEFKSWKYFPAKVLAVDRDFDLALLEFESQEEMPVAKINFAPEIFIGNKVWTFGCGLREAPRMDEGLINSVSTMKHKNYRISCFTVKGDSGGPTFHEYECIGLKQSNRAFQQGTITIPIYQLSYSIPMSKFLESESLKDYFINFEQ